MKFIILALAVLSVAQAKFLMSPQALTDAFERNEIDDSPVNVALLTEQPYIPMARYRSCNNGACATLCFFLGYKYGQCINGGTCRCSN